MKGKNNYYMNLNLEKWASKDGKQFNIYLESLRDPEKIEWSKKILNTEMSVLAIPTPIIKNIANQISKGNFLSFLELELNNYYENTAINGYLITKIYDFKLMKKYLDKYVLKIDNWASCDLLSFKIKDNEEVFFDLALEYLNNKKPFVRRVGLNIIFCYIDNDIYISRVFSVMNSLYSEEHYYVNMMNAWLFCECFIKRREMTLAFLKNHKLNKFTINKGISKCRDSYRVSLDDKELLLKYKIK